MVEATERHMAEARAKLSELVQAAIDFGRSDLRGEAEAESRMIGLRDDFADWHADALAQAERRGAEAQREADAKVAEDKARFFERASRGACVRDAREDAARNAFKEAGAWNVAEAIRTAPLATAIPEPAEVEATVEAGR